MLSYSFVKYMDCVKCKQQCQTDSNYCNSCLKNSTCWFCGDICFGFVSICDFCRIYHLHRKV